MLDGIASQVTWDGTKARLEVVGEVDAAAGPYVEDLFEGIIAAGATQIEIDASGISFMDSTGLRLVLLAGRRVDVWFGNASMPVQRLCELTGLKTVLLRGPESRGEILEGVS